MNEELLRRLFNDAGGNPDKIDAFLQAAKNDPTVVRKAYDRAGGKPHKFNDFQKLLGQSDTSPQSAQPAQTEQTTPEPTPQSSDQPKQVRDPQLSPAAEQWQPGDKPIAFGQDTQQQPETPTPDVMEPSAQNIPEPEDRLRAKTTRAQDIEEQTGEPIPGKVQEALAPLEKFRVDEDLYQADQVLSEMEESGRLADAEITPDGIQIKATGRDYQQRKREALGEQNYIAQKNKKPTLVERELPTREDGQSTLRQYRQVYEDLSTDNKELSDAFQAVNSRLKDEVGDDSLLGEYINLSFVRQIVRSKGEEGELTEQQVARSMEEIDKKIIEIAGEEGPTRELLDKGLKIFTLQQANDEEFKRLELDNEFAYARKVEELIETKQAMADTRNRQYNESSRLGKAKLTAMRMLHPALAGESNVTKSVLKAGARLAGNLGTLIRSGRSATPGLMGKFTAPENVENIIGSIDEGAAEKSEGARRAVGDFMMGLAEDIEDSYPVSSNRRRSPNSLVLKLDLEEMGVETQADVGKVQFDIDREGNILGAYDTEGYLIPDFEVTPELAQTISANKDKAKPQWNTDGLYQTISDTALDLGVQIMIMKGMGAGASAGKVGNALINTGVTAGMMMQSQYTAGLEAFDGDEDKAMDYAITTGLLVGAASNAFGMEARLVGGKPLFQSGVGKAAMPKGALKRVVNRTGGSPALSAARVVTLGTLGETTEETILETGINMATASLMGGEADMPDKEELKSIAAVSMAVGFLGSMSNVGSGVRERQSKLYAASVNGARADLPGFKTQLRKAIDAGKIDVPTRAAAASDAEKAAYVEEVANRVEYIDVSLSQLDVPEDATPDLIPLLDMKYDRVRALQGRNVSRQRVTPSTARARQLETEIQEIDKRIDKITGVPPLPEEEAEKEIPAKAPKELKGDGKDTDVPIMEDGPDTDVATINEQETPVDADSQTGAEQESQEAGQTIEETPVQGEGEQQAVKSAYNRPADVVGFDDMLQEYSGPKIGIIAEADDAFLEAAKSDLEFRLEQSRENEGRPVIPVEGSWPLVETPDGRIVYADITTGLPISEVPAEIATSFDDLPSAMQGRSTTVDFEIEQEARATIPKNTAPFTPTPNESLENPKVSFKRITNTDDSVYTGINKQRIGSTDLYDGGEVGQLFGVYQGGKKVGTIVKHGTDLDKASEVEYTHLETGINAPTRKELLNRVDDHYSEIKDGSNVDYETKDHYFKEATRIKKAQESFGSAIEEIDAELQKRTETGKETEATVEDSTGGDAVPRAEPDPEIESLLTQAVGEKLTEEVSQTVEANLQEVMPGLKVRALPDAEFREQTGSEDPAFVDYDENVIYVNSDQATSRQVYEEAAHVALTQRASKKQQVELARTIESELMAGTDDQRRMGTELSEETTRYENGIEGRSDEFLSKLAGRLAEAGETLSPRRSQRIMQRVNNFFGRLLGRKPNFKNFADAADFLNNIATGVRQGGLTATDSGSGGRGRSFSKRQDNAIVLTNMYRNDPSVNPTQLAAAMADRGFSITTREAFDHKMDMIERGIINVPDSVVKRDQDAILNDDPAYAGIRNSVEETTRTIRENANDLLTVLSGVEGQIENSKLRDLVPRLRSAVSSGDPVRIANVVREMSPVLRADSFGTGAAAKPAKDAVKAQLSAMGIDKPGIRKNLNGFAEAASKDENIRTAREMEQQVRARGMSPDETIGPGNTKQTISGTFSFMTNSELNALRADIGYDRMEATERKSIDQTLNEARELLDTDGSGYRHEVESGLMGVTGPSAIAEKSLSGLPITEAELAAMGMTVRHIVEKRAEKAAILNELKNSPKLTMRRQSQLEDAIERDNRDIERYTRAIKRAKSSGARILSTTRWLNLTEKLYSPDWMRQKLYESVGEGNKPTQGQIDALEESIKTMQAAEARIEQLEKEETEAAKPVYEARAEQAFEEMQMAVTPDNVGTSPFWKRLLGKGRPRTLQDAVDQYAETLNDETSTFFKRNVAFHEIVRHLSLETDSVEGVIDRLLRDYPNIAPDRETTVARVQDALVNLSPKDVAKKRIEIKGRIKTINKAKEGIADLRAGFEKLNRPYSKSSQITDAMNEALPGINDAIKKVHSLISQRVNLSQKELDNGLIPNGVNLNPDDIHQAYQKLAEVNGGIATLSRNSGENFDPQNAKRELDKIFQAINRMEEYMQIEGNKADTRVTELQARLDALSQDNPDLSAMYDGKNIDRIDPLLSEPELNQIRAARKSISGDLASALRRVNRLLTKKVDEEEIFTSHKIQVPTGRTITETTPTLELPPKLRKSNPKYKDVDLTFEDDLAKAIYIVGGKGKSKNHDAFLQWLNDNYGTETDWEDVGTQMRDTIKSSVENGATSFRLGAPKSIARTDAPTQVTRQEMREVKVWTAKSVKKEEKRNLSDTEKIQRVREERIQRERNRINNIVSELSGMIDLRKSVNVSELIRLGGELRQLLRDYPEIVGSMQMADKLLEERNLLDNVFRIIERNKKIAKEDSLRAAREKLRQEYEKKQEEIMNDMERVAAVELDADSFRFVKVTQRILDQEKIVAREKSRFDAMMKKFRRQAQVNQRQSALGRASARAGFGVKDGWEIGRSLIYMADMSYFGNQLYPFIMKYLGDFDLRRGLELAKETDGTWSDGAWAALSGTMPNMGGMLNVMKRGSWDIAKQHVSNWLKTEEDRRQLTEQLMRQITDDPFYRLFKDAGLELASPGTIEFADEMWKSDFNQYVLTDKLFGRTRDLSEDLMTVTINMARMEMMKDYYLSHPRATMQELTTYATGVNLFTGRGSTKNKDKWFNKPIGFLSYALSAPRLLISKIVLGARMLPFHIMGYQGYAMGAELLGAYGGGLVGGLIGINATQRAGKLVNRYKENSPAVRAHIDDLASAARGFLMTYHGISAITQIAAPLIGSSDIGDDPDEAKDYLKVRIDDVILDPSGGFGSLYRTALKIFQLGAGSAYGSDGKDLMTEYLITNRLHPSANVIWGAYTGQDFFGAPYAKKDADLGFMTVPQELLSHVFALQALLPITYQQILEGFNQARSSDEGVIDVLGTASFTTTTSFLGVNAYQVETDLQRAEAREIPNRLGVKDWKWPKPTYPSSLDLPGIQQQRTVNNTLVKIPPGTGFTDKKVFQESVQMNELKRRYTEVYENAYAHMLALYPTEETISKLEETIYPGDNSDVAKQARWEVILKGKEGDGIVSLKEFWEDEGFPETVKNLFFGDPEVRNLVNVMPLNPDFVKMKQLEEVYGK